MPLEKYLEKIDSQPGQLSFESLVKEGLHILQGLAGSQWTDYNPHDPGVTILEQLCYALTEMDYRAGFPIEAYLSSSSHEIGYDRQALYLPKDIYPSGVLTANDYRKILFDAVPDLADIWIKPDNIHGYRGIYSILVQPRRKYADNEHAAKEMIGALAQAYANSRCLGEDIQEIRIAKNIFVELKGNVQIDNSREAEEILAEIYFTAYNHILPGIHYTDFLSLKREGWTLEEMMSGPALAHGFVRDEDLHEQRAHIDVEELASILSNIPGVQGISTIYLALDSAVFKSGFSVSDPATIPLLKIPGSDKEICIELERNGRAYPINTTKMSKCYWKLAAQQWQSFHAKQDPSIHQSDIKSLSSDFASYTSIQHHFPAIYGINAHGVPRSGLKNEEEFRQRSGQAKQLKAYLAVFEQLIANFFQQLAQLKDLYSADDTLSRTYFTQTLKDIPAIAELYFATADDPFAEAKIAEAMAAIDPYCERRGRVLDYLLALYGEQLDQSHLRHFNYYLSETEFQQSLIADKLRLLKNTARLSRDRALAGNYLSTQEDGYGNSCASERFNILLAIENKKNSFFRQAFSNRHLKPASSHDWKLWLDKSRQILKDSQLAAESIEQGFDMVDYQAISANEAEISILSFIGRVEILHDGLIHDDLLIAGISLSNYRFGKLSGQSYYTVFLWLEMQKEWAYISRFAAIEEVVADINQLRRILLSINQECEGVHLVEHILLRPIHPLSHCCTDFLDSAGKPFLESAHWLDFAERNRRIEKVFKDLGNPRIYKVRLGQFKHFEIYIGEEEDIWYRSVEVYDSEADARSAIAAFCEGFANAGKYAPKRVRRFSRRGAALKVPDEFYSCRLSAVFPSWSARFRDSQFRLLAQETLSTCLPAHISAGCIWLDIDAMDIFEKHFSHWQAVKAQTPIMEESAELEIASFQLIKFIMEQKASGERFI